MEVMLKLEAGVTPFDFALTALVTEGLRTTDEGIADARRLATSEVVTLLIAFTSLTSRFTFGTFPICAAIMAAMLDTPEAVPLRGGDPDRPSGGESRRYPPPSRPRGGEVRPR